MKTVLRIVAVLVLLAAAAAGWAGYEAWTFLKTPPATPGQEAFFDVEPGASVRRVADRLEERGLITDARKFLLLARYKKWDSRLFPLTPLYIYLPYKYKLQMNPVHYNLSSYFQSNHKQK